VRNATEEQLRSIAEVISKQISPVTLRGTIKMVCQFCGYKVHDKLLEKVLKTIVTAKQEGE
jgi:hypothetical protein